MASRERVLNADRAAEARRGIDGIKLRSHPIESRPNYLNTNSRGHIVDRGEFRYINTSVAPEDSLLIRTARQVNDEKPQRVLAQVARKAKRFKRPVIACFGLAFKADIDDIRESTALSIVEALSDTDDSFEVLVVEPNLGTLPPSLAGKARFVKTSEALDRADIVVLLVNHREFAKIDRAHLHDKVVIDTRGTWS